MKKSAIISPCGKYRYTLTRTWDESGPTIMWVMLNPSTADADQDDPTIIRCIAYSKAWGYGSLVVCNLFAYRATNPKDILQVDNPFGDQNIWHCAKAAEGVRMIICAWGNKPIVEKILKDQDPVSLLPWAKGRLHYLKLTATGWPWHPLYLKKDLMPIPF